MALLPVCSTATSEQPGQNCSLFLLIFIYVLLSAVCAKACCGKYGFPAVFRKLRAEGNTLVLASGAEEGGGGVSRAAHGPDSPCLPDVPEGRSAKRFFLHVRGLQLAVIVSWQV